jgi:hypothetical protein
VIDEPEAAPDPAEQQTDRAARRTIFVSFSHRDSKWVTELRKVINSSLASESLDFVNADQSPTPGVRWEDEVNSAIAGSRAAIVLISADYLTSEFCQFELQLLQRAVLATQLRLFWIAVSPCEWESTPIARFQAVNDPNRPLSTLTKAAQQRVMVEIGQRFKTELGDGGDTEHVPVHGRIFICYRRGAESAARLADRLRTEFGDDEVFHDISSLVAGVDWAEAIGQAVEAATVMLVVIDRNWSERRGPGGGRRLDSEADWTRFEVAAALGRDMRVIPILVGGARMPMPDELPPELRPLALRNALELTDPYWDEGIAKLLQTLRPLVRKATRAERAADRSSPQLSPLRIFLSCTHLDLVDHRAAVTDALRRLTGVVLISSNLSSESGPLETHMDDVATCDALILVVAWRYGFVPKGHDRSIIELDYDAARHRGIPVLGFLADEKEPWPPDTMDSTTGEGDQGKRISAFRERLRHDLLMNQFRTPDDLAYKVTVAVQQFLMRSREKPR